MRLDVITIFPDYFTSPLAAGLLGKAIDAGVFEVGVHDLRDWSEGVHRKVDDIPYGGGAGMVMSPGPVVAAVETVRVPGAPVLLLSASGRPFRQTDAARLSGVEQVVVVCGRYEGMDARIAEVLGAEEFSIGEFVLAGGEVAALAVIEAVSRLIPGVLGNAESLAEESFTSGMLEYPQYTRPQEFRGLVVPDVLVSGNHAAIAAWRREAAVARTRQMRPELLKSDEEGAEPAPGLQN